MPTRREFLLSTASATVLLTVGGCAALGGALDNAVESAAAVTCVFGDGMWLVAVAVKYRADVSAAVLEPSQYGVAGRTVERVQMLPVFLTVIAFVGINGRTFGQTFQ